MSPSKVPAEGLGCFSLAFHTKCSVLYSIPVSHIKYHTDKRMVSCVFNLKYLGQDVHVGGVLKSSGAADSKSTPGFENWQDLWE